MKKVKRIICVCLCISTALLTGCGTNSAVRDETTTLAPTARDINATAARTTESPVTTESEQPQSFSRVITGQAGADTSTGYAPLPEISFTVEDPENKAGLSEEKTGHSHGPASGGKAHYTVVEFQKNFDRFGALTLDTVSREKVVYLTFDCGWENNNLTSRILDTLKEKQVKAAFFCTLTHIKQQHALIVRMIKEGHIVGNHSVTHPSFPSISREKMAEEILGLDNYMRVNYGYSARYFRFPAGEYSESAMQLVQSMGYMSVFWSLAYDDWDVTKTRGAQYAVDTVMSRLHPGAVILLHSVSEDNADALPALIDKIRAQGYEFRSLDEYRPTGDKE
ncbi:MAG: polysaccharide deacetylase family protein [Clostridia bacterium]|nr:polysaccharide deacetylase family protein [Clostridia bacterium]